MRQDYRRYSPEVFGALLVATGDLDPVYLLARKGIKDQDTLARFCLAYWFFYHVGVAARIAESGQELFWLNCFAAEKEKWPRGTERRHFRGELANTSIDWIQRRYGAPEFAVWDVAADTTHRPSFELAKHMPPQIYHVVMRRAQEWRGFGPWISFKVADMVDAVLGVPVSFLGSEADFFDAPIGGAERIWTEKHGEDDVPYDAVAMTRWSVQYLADRLGHLEAPHANRPLAPQEYETILCKYKSHLNGRYPIGNDFHEISHGLRGWGDLADHLNTVLTGIVLDRVAKLPLTMIKMPLDEVNAITQTFGL